MGIQNLVLSIKQMKHLKELGLDITKTALCWQYDDDIKDWKVVPNRKGERQIYEWIKDNVFPQITSMYKIIPTLTLQEILELLPSVIIKNYIEYHLDIDYAEGVVRYSHRNALALYIYMLQEIKSDNPLKAAYEMLCWILENGYLNTNNE